MHFGNFHGISRLMQPIMEDMLLLTHVLQLTRPFQNLIILGWLSSRELQNMIMKNGVFAIGTEISKEEKPHSYKKERKEEATQELERHLLKLMR